MTEEPIYRPEPSEEITPSPSDSRTESAAELEPRDHWMETEENKSQHRHDDSSLADDEEEDDEDDDDGKEPRDAWLPEKAAQAFTPNVMIVQPTAREDVQMREMQMEKIPLYVQNFHTNPPQHFHPAWIDHIDKPEGTARSSTAAICEPTLKMFVWKQERVLINITVIVYG